jgi:hypothetical protein
MRLTLLALVFGLSACSFSLTSAPNPYSAYPQALAAMHGRGKPPRRVVRDAAPALAKADKPAKPAELDPPAKTLRAGPVHPVKPGPAVMRVAPIDPVKSGVAVMHVGPVDPVKPGPAVMRVGPVDPPKPEARVLRVVNVVKPKQAEAPTP